MVVGGEGRSQAGYLLNLCPLQLEGPAQPPVLTSTPTPKSELAIIPATRNEPIGLKASDFLPVSGDSARGVSWQPWGVGRAVPPAPMLVSGPIL